MKIDNDVKLDFSDVLIRPKRSNLDSRNKVDLKRTFVFKLSETNSDLMEILFIWSKNNKDYGY